MLKEYWEIVKRAKENPYSFEGLALNQAANSRSFKYKNCLSEAFEIIAVTYYKNIINNLSYYGRPEIFRAEYEGALPQYTDIGQMILGESNPTQCVTKEDHPELDGIVVWVDKSRYVYL